MFGVAAKPNDSGYGSGNSGGGIVSRPRSIHYDPSSHQVGPPSIMKRRSMIEGGRYSRYEDDMWVLFYLECISPGLTFAWLIDLLTKHIIHVHLN